MDSVGKVLQYLKKEKLILAIAESCTAGETAAILVKHGNCGDCLFLGYTVYSATAKQKCLGVQTSTIKKYTLTSEPVAREMVSGLFKHKEINAAIATTGITGSESLDGIPPGTVCFGWGFKLNENVFIFSETKRFLGSNAENIQQAANYALKALPHFHAKAKLVEE